MFVDNIVRDKRAGEGGVADQMEGRRLNRRRHQAERVTQRVNMVRDAGVARIHWEGSTHGLTRPHPKATEPHERVGAQVGGREGVVTSRWEVLREEGWYRVSE